MRGRGGGGGGGRAERTPRLKNVLVSSSRVKFEEHALPAAEPAFSNHPSPTLNEWKSGKKGAGVLQRLSGVDCIF